MLRKRQAVRKTRSVGGVSISKELNITTSDVEVATGSEVVMDVDEQGGDEADDLEGDDVCAVPCHRSS
jgi:hypothetical protein